jgi:hypothetical protein
MKQPISGLGEGIIAALAAAAVLMAVPLTATEVLAGGDHKEHKKSRPTGLVKTVLTETRMFRNVNEATAQGYGLFLGCVSSPHEGAMGVHYVNGGLVGDGMLDAAHPEALVYEPRRGRLKLVAVEYVVLADAWHLSNEQPPSLDGQVFNYVGSPNRYGLPAFYELHVWAWKENPHGTFSDHHPRVSCDDYSADEQ